MFSITEIPRVEGLIDGDFKAKHRSNTFGLEGFGFRFLAGITVEPIRGRIADRLQAAYGNDVSYVPCDQKSADMALSWMRRHCHPAARLERAEAEVATIFAPTIPAPVAEVPALVAVAETAPLVPAMPAPVPDPEPAVPEQPSAPEGSAAAEQPAPAPVATPVDPGTPTTKAELDALPDEAIRELGKQLDMTDGRWSIQRLKREIAEELGIE